MRFVCSVINKQTLPSSSSFLNVTRHLWINPLIVSMTEEHVVHKAELTDEEPACFTTVSLKRCNNIRLPVIRSNLLEAVRMKNKKLSILLA